MHRTKLAASAALISLTTLVTACGGGGDVANKIADKAAEKAAEKAGGGNVDIDTSGGEVKVKTKDGTYEVDKNGNVKATGKDGDSTYSAGSGTKLPADWPSELDPPAGTKLMSSSTTTDNGQKLLMVIGQLSGSVDDVYAGLKQQLTEAGVTLSSDSSGSTPAGSYGALGGESDEYEVQATISEVTSDANTTSVTMTVRLK